MSDAPPRTHNLPPLADIIPPDVIEAHIDAVKAPLVTRRDELVASGQRFIAAHPTIASDEADSTAAQVLSVLARFTGKSGPVETARIELLKPLRAAVTTIGSYEKGPFATVIDSVERVSATIRKASIAYKQEKETQARAARQAEADRLAREAEMAEELARKGSGAVSLDDAVTAAQAAEKAQDAASVRPAELTRSHGSDVGVSSLRYRRKFTVVEPDKVERRLCSHDDSKIRAVIGKAGDPLPTLAGIYVFDEPDLTVGT